jgi:hypothetical protein
VALWARRSYINCRSYRQVVRVEPMKTFRVKLDYVDGKWIKNHPRPVVEVLAATAKEAAELACGETLRSKGRYRAQVWPLGGVRHAHQISHFYSA